MSCQNSQQIEKELPFQLSNLNKNKSPSGSFILTKINNAPSSSSSSSVGHNAWKSIKKIKYLNFILRYSPSFQETKGKMFWEIYKNMAKYITTRNPNQCRLFHKQMMKKFNSIPSMLMAIRKQVPNLSKIIEGYQQQLTRDKHKSGIDKKQNTFIRTVHQTKFEKIDFQQLQDDVKIQESLIQYPHQFILQQPNKQQKLQNLKTDVTIKNDNVQITRRSSIRNSDFQQPFLNLNQPIYPWMYQFSPFFPSQGFYEIHNSFLNRQGEKPNEQKRNQQSYFSS